LPAHTLFLFQAGNLSDIIIKQSTFISNPLKVQPDGFAFYCMILRDFSYLNETFLQNIGPGNCAVLPKFF
jgi:hypothetical protein